jgi:hypothetical protein
VQFCNLVIFIQRFVCVIIDAAHGCVSRSHVPHWCVCELQDLVGLTHDSTSLYLLLLLVRILGIEVHRRTIEYIYIYIYIYVPTVRFYARLFFWGFD